MDKVYPIVQHVTVTSISDSLSGFLVEEILPSLRLSIYLNSARKSTYLSDEKKQELKIYGWIKQFNARISPFI
jgi:hypothetical protein